MTGRELLSNLKLYSDYMKWNGERYETWEEACKNVINSTHKKKYEYCWDKLSPHVSDALESYINKDILASQRNLQYRGDQIFKHNARLYNCCVTYCYSADVFSKVFYILLCGTGVGVSLREKFVKQLPLLRRRSDKAETFVIEDSIEGWADAANALIMSFCQGSREIKFDYSQIRPKGSFISGGFKAPGPEGLKQSLERIEDLLRKETAGQVFTTFRSIIAYDILMHLSDAVLSGGVRRSAMCILIDKEDTELIHAKTGNWRQKYPWRARSNNSVGLIRGEFSPEELQELIDLNQGDNDIGFVFTNSEDDLYNPCFEIGFNFYGELPDTDKAVFQFCNLNEINAYNCLRGKSVDKQKFYRLCRDAAVLGTLQAGYTDFPYLGDLTEKVVKGEALLGISITGLMLNPSLIDGEILQEGAKIVKETNAEIADIIGINKAARTTCIKPSGNSAVVLGTTSGVTPDHSERYFRIMQLNKESDIANYLLENLPDTLEESAWSSTNSDYVIHIPVENLENAITKNNITGLEHLELISKIQKNFIWSGKRESCCYNKDVQHNVSCTVILDDPDEIYKYLFKNQNVFSAVSFLPVTGDKDYKQAPFTSVLNTKEILEKYGEGCLFASGLIVDGLHYYNDDLWGACDAVRDNNTKLTGSRDQVLLKKDWIRRVKKFSKKYFKGDIENCIYCLKDVHLYHKWCKIGTKFKDIDFSTVLTAPSYSDIDRYSAVSCSGGSCEITTL